ncbi:MAG: hypothetical protein AB7P07_09245 [Hyphomonadaceae bacterium]
MLTLLKKFTPLQQLARRAPPYYQGGRALLARYERADEAERTRLLDGCERELVTAARAAPAYATLDHLAQAPLLTKSEVRAAPARYRARTLLPVSVARTSGTSGASLEVARSVSLVMFEQAAIDWLVAKSGLDFSRAKIAVLRADTIKPPEDREPPFWTISADRRIVTLSAHHLDVETLPAYAEMLASFEPDILYAYPSAALNLALLAARAKRDIQFKLALTSSEELPPQTRARLTETFRCKSIDYYGQAERVAFAWSTEPERYFFLPAYGRVELPDGASGAPEIVGACFHNRAQFLLRYRTGDHIVLGEGSDRDAILRGDAPFAGVSGRASDVVYGPEGEVFLGLNHIPRPFDQIEALQIIQTGPGAVTILVRSERDRSDALREQVRTVARQKIGPVVALDVEFADALRKSTAGKTPFVIHDWKPVP